MSDNTPITMQTPAAVLAPKQQYLNLLMNSVYKFSEICSNPTIDTTEAKRKTVMLARMIIAYIPNEEERNKLYSFREESIKEFEKTNKDKTALIDFTFTLDTQIVGKIMSLMDELLAITDRQAILTSGSPCNDLELKYYAEGVHQVLEEEESE